jgi:hypothetical protein
VHLRRLFEKLPVETLHDMVLDGDVRFVDLLHHAERLEVAGENVDWLKEMVGEGVVQAA